MADPGTPEAGRPLRVTVVPALPPKARAGAFPLRPAEAGWELGLVVGTSWMLPRRGGERPRPGGVGCCHGAAEGLS